MKTKLIQVILKIVIWIIFIGILVKTGVLIFTFFSSLFINPEAAKNLYQGLNLSELLRFSIRHYSTLLTFIIILSGLKAYIFYLVIKIYSEFKLDRPFSIDTAFLILEIRYVSVGIGLLALLSNFYSHWLTKSGVALDTLPKYLEDSIEFLLFAGIVTVIAQVFKRGIEIQSEYELTV